MNDGVTLEGVRGSKDPRHQAAERTQGSDIDKDLSALAESLDDAHLGSLLESADVGKKITLVKCGVCSMYTTHDEIDCNENPRLMYDDPAYLGEDVEEAAEERREKAQLAYQQQLRTDPMEMQEYYSQAIAIGDRTSRISPDGSFAATHAVLSTTELLELILKSLRLPDLLRCQAVCQKFKAVIAECPDLEVPLWRAQETSEDSQVQVNYHMLQPSEPDQSYQHSIRTKLRRSIKDFPRLRYHVPLGTGEKACDPDNLDVGGHHELDLLIRPEFLEVPPKYASFCSMYLSDCKDPIRVRITQYASEGYMRGPYTEWWESIVVWMKPAPIIEIYQTAVALYCEVANMEAGRMWYEEDSDRGYVEFLPNTLTEKERAILLDRPVIATERRDEHIPETFDFDFNGAESEVDWENDSQEIARRADEIEAARPSFAEIIVPRHLCMHCLRYVVHPPSACWYNEEVRRMSSDQREVDDPRPEDLWISDANNNWTFEQLQLHDDKLMDDPLQLVEYMSQAMPASHPAYSVDPSSKRSAASTVFNGTNVKVLEHILSHLKARDLIRCERVSRKFQYTISKSDCLKERLWHIQPLKDPEEEPGCPLLNYYILSYENACKSTKRCRLNVKNANQWPQIRYFVPEAVAPIRAKEWGQKPRLEIRLSPEMTPESLQGSSFLKMYLSDVTAATWVSITHMQKLGPGSPLPFERVDVKLHPAPLGVLLRIASKLYQEALKMHGPRAEHYDHENIYAQPFVPSTLTADEQKLVVGRVGLFERYGSDSLWFRGVGQAFAVSYLDGGDGTEHAEEEDGDAYELSEEELLRARYGVGDQHWFI